MLPALSAVAGMGLVLGLRHAFEPDHLAAVSTLATRQGSLLAGCRLAFAWALGHTASVGAVVLVFIVTGAQLPPALQPVVDLVVALLLIGLGGSVFYRYARGRWHLHAHTHGSSGAPHLHLHSHARGPAHAHSHRTADVRRAFGFGLLHGFAGSGTIVILLVAAASTTAIRLGYFAAFSAGTVLGMLFVSGSLAAITRLAAGNSDRLARALHLSTAAASVAIGAALAVRTAVSLV